MKWSCASAMRWLLVAVVLCSAPIAWADSPSAAPIKRATGGLLWAYIGTYTGKGSKGIYRLDFDPATGQLSSRALVAELSNPTFLATDPSHRFLYAVNEISNLGGKKTGGVTGFAIDAKTGVLTPLNQQPSGGAGPCHLVVDRLGKHVLVANYVGGSVAVLPIEADGRLGNATAFIQHKGSGPNRQRQEGPHAHCVTLDAVNRFAFVCDLGLDKVLIYRYNTAAGTLTPNDPPALDLAPGAGPRHLAFHPNGRYAYVINEINSTVTACSYDANRGALKTLQTLSTLPKGFTGNNTTAEMQVHPSGKFLYGSNRGHDSIAVFAIDARTGELTPLGEQHQHIKEPRNFIIDPSGAFLIVGNQNADNLAVFQIDPQSGALKPHGTPVEVPVPVCVQLLPRGP